MSFFSIRNVALAALMAGALSSVQAQTIHALGDVDPSAWNTNTWASRGRGWSFTVGSQDLAVSELGINAAGASGYDIVLWDLATSSSLAAVSVNASADAWTWASLSSSVTLTQGQSYAVIGYGTSATASYNYTPTAGQAWVPGASDDLAFIQTRYCNACSSSTLPTSGVNGHMYGPVDIGYTVVAAPVPEPESLAMLLAGLGVLGAVSRRRAPLASKG